MSGFEHLRLSLATSPRWNRLLAQLDIDFMAVARGQRFMLEDEPPESINEIGEWVWRARPEADVPAALLSYLEPYRKVNQ